jgi:hypothetical protein
MAAGLRRWNPDLTPAQIAEAIATVQASTDAQRMRWSLELREREALQRKLSAASSPSPGDGQENQFILPATPAHSQRIDAAIEERMLGADSAPEELRQGRPRPISDERVAQLVRKTLKTKPKDGTHWSIRQLATETNYATHKHRRVRRWRGQFQVISPGNRQ